MNSKYPFNPVLLVDDEEHLLQSGSFALRTSGISNVMRCSDSRKVMVLLREKPVSVIILDLMMPFINGDELLPDADLVATRAVTIDAPLSVSTSTSPSMMEIKELV